MNEIAFYINALLVMYDLSLETQQSALPDWETWELPEYAVRIAVKTMQLRYAVWGLWQGVQRNADAGLWPMDLKMSWNGNAVGQIVVAPHQRFLTNITDEVSLPVSNDSGAFQSWALNTTTSGRLGTHSTISALPASSTR